MRHIRRVLIRLAVCVLILLAAVPFYINRTRLSKDAQQLQIREIPYKVVFHRAQQSADYSGLFAFDDEGQCQTESACKWPKMPGASRDLVKWAPEVFDKIPRHFLPNFKSPCWTRGDQADLNCLPYFYIIGMYKSATFDVWDKLTAHPDVVGDVPKEPHWWGPRRNGFTFIPCNTLDVLRARNVTQGGDDSSLEWYLNLYKFSAIPDILKNRVVTKEGSSFYPKVFGEASVTTASIFGFSWSMAFPHTREPPFTNADLMRAVQPSAKIVLMIRNPTKRAESLYWYTECKEGSAKGFHQYVLDFIRCFKTWERRKSLRFSAYLGECKYLSMIPGLENGIYHIYIKDWLQAFNRTGFHVIRLEDWQQKPKETYRDLLKFLELRALNETEAGAILNRRRRNVSWCKNRQVTLPETWKLLNDFYRPHNRLLGALMGDEKYNYPDYNGRKISNQ